MCVPCLQFLPPVFLPIPRADGTYASGVRQHGLVVVAGSDGSVGAYNAHGQRLWMVSAIRGVHWGERERA